MSEREEVTAILSDVYDDIHNRKYDLEKSADRIMKLPVFEKLERVREYCEKELKFWKGYVRLRENYNDGLRNGRIETLEEILSILNQQEGEFDVREWLDKNATKSQGKYYMVHYRLYLSDSGTLSITIYSQVDYKEVSVLNEFNVKGITEYRFIDLLKRLLYGVKL